MKIETPRQPREDYWWELVLIGLFFVGVAYYFYVDLAAFEEQGGQRKIMWLFALLYNTFGKLGVAVPISIMGLGFILSGLLKFTRIRTNPDSNF